MRTSFILAGLVVSFTLFLLYNDLVPALMADPLPSHKPAYQLGTEKSYSRYEEPPDRPLSLVFNGKPSKIFTFRGNGAVQEWDVVSRSQANIFHTNSIFSYAAPLNSIITKNVADNVGILELDSKRVTPLARDFYIHSAVDRSGTLLLLSTGGKSLEMWKLDTRRLSKRWDAHLPIRNGVAISSTGKYVAAAEGIYDSVENFHHTTIQLWELNNKTPRFLFNDENAREAHGVWNLRFSPDSSMIAADTQVDGKAGATVWDTQTGKRVFEVRGFDSYWMRALAFSPGGKYLAIGDELGNLIIWSFDLREKVWRANVKGQVIHSIAFSPDGQLLAAGIQDSTIQVWDIALPFD